MRRAAELRRLLQQPLDDLGQRLAAGKGPTGHLGEVTMLCIPRHGYATTKACIESIYATTQIPFALVYVDVDSPKSVSDYLVEQAARRPSFFHLRVDELASRQTARLLVLERIVSHYVLFLDNNMLFDRDWLGRLITVSEEEGAAVVSPLIVTQGGNLHFGAAQFKDSSGKIVRAQSGEECRQGANVRDARAPLQRRDIDFGESHCCLMTMERLKDRIPELFPEEMHNAHTILHATRLLQSQYDVRMLLEPTAVASILPVCFGYDLPWLFLSYNDLGCFRESYSLCTTTFGESDTTTPANLDWHRRHLLYLLLSMCGTAGYLERESVLEPHEVPSYVPGYDHPLPEAAEETLRNGGLLPFLRAHHPALEATALGWIDGTISKRASSPW